MISAKVQPLGILSSGREEDFYHIWVWLPSWSTGRDHFSNFSFPYPTEASEEKSFENVNGWTHGRTDDGLTQAQTQARMDGWMTDEK